MAHVILFHHAQGLTPGVGEFADELRGAGHEVTLPDLYEGATFGSLDDGVGYAEQLGFGTIIDRGRAAAEGVLRGATAGASAGAAGGAAAGAAPPGIVYAGFSLGVLPAQMLAQTRPGAKGALLFHSCIPASEFGDAWPPGLPVQIHAMDADPFFVGDGDIDAARDLVQSAEEAELFLYPGDQHLFADSSLPSYDESAATLLRQRVLSFLDGVG